MTEIITPTQVLKDAETTVEARVRVRHLPAGEINIELFDAGPPRKRLGEKKLVHPGKDGVLKTTFDLKLDSAGVHRLRVLLVDEEARWENHYLAMALGRDPDLRVERILFDPVRLGLVKDDERDKARLPATRWPDFKPGEEDPLWRYDVIILGDVGPERLPPVVQSRLEKFVADREGTLILSAGKRHLPSAYVSDAPFRRLIPIENVRPVLSKEGFALIPTEAGLALPFLQIADKEDVRRRWKELPKLFWGVAGKPRPGATDLADLNPAPGESTLAPDRSSNALIVLQRVGLGKVLWIGVDGTWRWRYRVGDRDHHRFWGQLVRWAATDSGGDLEGNRIALFGSRKPAYAFGAAIETFLLLGSSAPDLDSRGARLKVLRIEDGRESVTTSVLLGRSERRPKLWEAKIAKLPPGEYRLEPDVPELVGKLPAEEAARRRDRFTVLPPETGELSDLAVNWDLLRALAESTGGRLFTIDDVDQLPERLRREMTTKDERRETRLGRDSPYVWWLMGVLLGLLTVEWILRKVAGLP